MELAEAPKVRAHAVLGDVLGEAVHLDGVVVHGDHVLIVLLADLVLEPVQVHGDADHQEPAEEVDHHDAERSFLVSVRHGAALRLLVLVKQHRAEAEARVARELGVGRAVLDVGLMSEVEEVPQREDEEPEERGVRAEQHEPEGDAVAENLRHHHVRRADQLVLTAVALLVWVRGVARLQAAHVLLCELVLRGVGEPFLGLLPLRVLALGQLNRHLECRQILLGRGHRLRLRGVALGLGGGAEGASPSAPLFGAMGSEDVVRSMERATVWPRRPMATEDVFIRSLRSLSLSHVTPGRGERANLRSTAGF